jgi:tetratricopeptide (TPR) repeat protein
MNKARRGQKKPDKFNAAKKRSNPLPAYLLKRPTPPITIPPPVLTRPQLLPFGKLTWENFEHLCKSLIEIDHEVRTCHLYGRLGQKQRGIDLIAYPKTFQAGRPRVYQCKRVETFGRAHIKGAIDKFLKGKWKPWPTEFVICWKSSLRSTECQDEILKQGRRLQKIGITFQNWDAEELSTKLKDSPKIVDDYFGREWVRVFIGPEAVEFLERRFEPAAAGPVHRSDQVERLLLSKDLEIQGLISTIDLELSRTCDGIKEKYKEGRQSEAREELQSYIDRFQTDLHQASSVVRAKFWYTLGVLSWHLHGGAVRAQLCLDNARQIDSTFDVRPLEARVLFASRQYDAALTVLQAADTLPVFTLLLAMLLDLGKLTAFDKYWSTSTVQLDAVAYQLLAFRCRLDRRFIDARNAIQKAIDLAPNVPSHYVAAGHIIFWEAVPEHLDQTSRAIPPATFHPIFYRPTSRQTQLLDEAVEYYDKAISSLSQLGTKEADQLREVEGYRLLCMAYQSRRQSEAKRLAIPLLGADPVNFTALFYCSEWGVEFDVNTSIDALESKRLNKQATLDQLYMLTELYKHQDKSGQAIDILKEEEKRFAEEKARYLWAETMMELLSKTDVQSAISFVEQYQSDDPILKNRLRAVLYDRVGDYSNLEEVGIQLCEGSSAALDLLNLCGFYRKTEQWGKLEPYARRLVERSADPGSVSMLAHALYHNRKFSECLTELEKHAVLVFDGTLPDELRRIEIECLFKLNRLDKAITHLETLLQEQPSSGLVHNLAQAYFRLGRREKAVAVLKQAGDAPWADSTLRIEATQVLLNESPDEAFRLAQKVKEDSPNDQRAWLHYIETGFLTGHDREASETLLSFQKHFPETSLIQRVGLNDFIERAQELRKVHAKRWNLYSSAQVPTHVFMDAEAQALGLEWFTRFRWNKSVQRWDQKYPVFVRHGGRSVSSLDSATIETQSIIADYTAILIAHELNLLSVIEKAFSRIIIPPSLLVVLQADIHKATQYQPSRLQILQEIKDAIDAGNVGVSPDITLEGSLSRFKVETIGAASASLFCLAKQSGGLVFAKHLGNERDTAPMTDEVLAKIRVFPREVFTALYRLGALPQRELDVAVQNQPDEPCRNDMIDTLLQRPLLITDRLTLEFVAALGLLHRVTGTFTISIPGTEVESVTQTLRAYGLRHAAAAWLDELRRHISERLDKNYYFPAFSIDIDKEEKQEPCTLLLQELLHIAQREKLSVWVDDRFIQRYERMEQAPLLSTLDVVALLRRKNAISTEEYFQVVNRLMELKAQFLPMDPEAIHCFLIAAEKEESGDIRESYELKTVRRYFADNFAKGTPLCASSPEAGKLPECAFYYQQHQSLCRTLLQKVWCSTGVSQDRKQAMSHWVVARLWKGLEDIRHLLPKPLPHRDAVAVSQFTLLGIAFEILLREIPNIELSSSYFHWLYDHFLETNWANNPDVKEFVIKRMAAFLNGMVQAREEELRAPLLAIYASLLVKAPSEIAEGLFADESLGATFKDYLRQTVQISEELRISVEEWRQWVFESINVGPGATVNKHVNGRMLTLQWQEPSPLLSGLQVQFVSKDGNPIIHTRIHTFIKLYHPSADTRKKALSNLLPYLTISQQVVSELAARLGVETAFEPAAIELEAIAESSWGFFWGRLTCFVQAGVPTSVDVLFPRDPAIFASRFPASLAVPEDSTDFGAKWLESAVSRFKTDGFDTVLTDFLSFPFGEGISSADIIGRLVGATNVHLSQVFDFVIKLASRTTNPVALQNCLDILLGLQEDSISYQKEIEAIVKRLLDSNSVTDPIPLDSVYDLYIAAMHFGWDRMKALEPFQNYSPKTRTIWAYAYGGALIKVLDDLRENQNILVDYTEFSKWLREKTKESRRAIFQGTFDEQLDVSHPLKIERFRTIFSGSVAVLVKHKRKLHWLRHQLLSKSLSIAKDAVQGAFRGGEEVFKPFCSTRNFFGSNFNRNAFSSLREIFESCGDDSLLGFNEIDQQMMKFIKEFDPGSALKTVLERILDAKRWELNDLILAHIALDEPLPSSSLELCKQAAACMDLSCWTGAQDFTLACGTLARFANASKDQESRQQVLQTL